jgi:hypothetical protein
MALGRLEASKCRIGKRCETLKGRATPGYEEEEDMCCFEVSESEFAHRSRESKERPALYQHRKEGEGGVVQSMG